MLQNFGTALSREQMKMVKGGGIVCTKTINSDCSGTGQTGSEIFRPDAYSSYPNSLEDTQDLQDFNCGGSDCCDDITCKWG